MVDVLPDGRPASGTASTRPARNSLAQHRRGDPDLRHVEEPARLGPRDPAQGRRHSLPRGARALRDGRTVAAVTTPLGLVPFRQPPRRWSGADDQEELGIWL